MGGEIESITTANTLLPGEVNNVKTILQDTLLEILETPYSLKQIETKLYDKKIHIISHGYLKGYLNAMMDNGLIYSASCDNITMYSTRNEFTVARRRCTKCNTLIRVFNFSTQASCPKCEQAYNVTITFESGATLLPVQR